MTKTRTIGNVIYADFRRPPEFAISLSYQMLYLDDQVALARLTYRFNGEEIVQHVCCGTGLNA